VYWESLAAARTAIAGAGLDALALGTANLLAPWQQQEQSSPRHEDSLAAIAAAVAEVRAFVASRPAEADEWLAAHRPPSAAPAATAALAARPLVERLRQRWLALTLFTRSRRPPPTPRSSAAASPCGDPRAEGESSGLGRLTLGMREEIDPPDFAIARLAGRQYGVVSIGQLRELRVDKSGVGRRVRSGKLHRVHRGVYAVGYRGNGVGSRWMAAVLACGKGAALSHRSAASHWGWLDATAGPVDISVPTHCGRASRPGIRLHRRRSLTSRQVVTRRHIPVTTPAQTIADLRQAVPGWQWRRAVRQAEMDGLRTGVATDGTRSDLERDFLRLCRRNRIPAPEVNVKVGRWTVDFLWRRQGVAVETDFYDYHRGRIAFQDDHQRDLDLRRWGFAVHRFSESQINERPAEVVVDLRDALGLAS